MQALETRARLLHDVRAFFHGRGVLEVQTAILGGATVTDPAVESFQVDGLGYLQPSPEYQLKRLLAAGAPSLYQLGPVFRAGESGRRHNPEFVMLEWYRLGFSDVELMKEVAELVDLILGPSEYRTLAYAEVVSLAGDQLAVPADIRPRELLDLRFSVGIEALGPGRFFVTDYPSDQAALARLRDEDATVAARFELVVDGLELANGYYELGNPDELRRRFQRDLEVRCSAGQHQPAVDEKFLAAMKAGLPDCAGVALGFDRLLMLKLGADDLADVMAFPIGRA